MEGLSSIIAGSFLSLHCLPMRMTSLAWKLLEEMLVQMRELPHLFILPQGSRRGKGGKGMKGGSFSPVGSKD